jgi:hypothetical protein
VSVRDATRWFQTLHPPFAPFPVSSGVDYGSCLNHVLGMKKPELTLEQRLNVITID